ncbi:hypothetical protein FKM82_027216 [Ascaphus truei]
MAIWGATPVIPGHPLSPSTLRGCLHSLFLGFSIFSFGVLISSASFRTTSSVFACRVSDSSTFCSRPSFSPLWSLCQFLVRLLLCTVLLKMTLIYL